MKKIVLIIMLVVILGAGLLFLTGCKLTLETTDNSVSASVAGATRETVGGLDRVFDFEVKTEVDKDSVTVTTGSSEKI